MKKVYAFEGESGPVNLADLFGDKQTLAIYSYMYGPQRKQPCPMCTSLLSAWDGEVKHIEQRIALVAVARSPIQRLVAFKKERGWRDLKVFSDGSGDYTPDYVSADVLRTGPLSRDRAAGRRRGLPVADKAGSAPLLRPLWLRHAQRQPGLRTRWQVGRHHAAHRHQRLAFR